MNKKATIILAALTIFNVDPSYDISGRSQIDADLKFTGLNAYYYVEKNAWQEDWRSKIQAMAKQFDDIIYPKMTEAYGSEWKPGIDNDPKITVLITPMPEQAGGYFNPIDGYLKSEAQNSNQREIVYLNSANIDHVLMKSFLAHEFQHLINFYQRKKLRWLDEEVWLNEALSEYASTVCGFDDPYEGSNLEKRARDFLKDPSNSLTNWQGTTYDYAPINLFMQYLAGRQGQEILKQIETSDKTGIKAIENFSSSFADWSVANYLNNCSLENGRFCYQNQKLKDFYVSPTASYVLMPITSLSIASVTKEWSPHWYKISGISQDGKTLKVDFSQNNQEAQFQVPYIVVDQNGQFAVKTLNNTGYVPRFGKDINSIIVVPVSNEESGFSLTVAVVQLPAPIIETISPAKEALGAIITIKGKNFIEGVKVRFGNQEAEKVEILNSETINVVAPQIQENFSGLVNVTVINPDEQAALILNGFEYKKKELTPEEFKIELKAKIAEIQIRILELQRELLLIKIQEIQARIAELLNK